jgi:hypothetical protein
VIARHVVAEGRIPLAVGTLPRHGPIMPETSPDLRCPSPMRGPTRLRRPCG